MIKYLVEIKIYPMLLQIFSVFSKLQICNIMLLHIDKYESQCIYISLCFMDSFSTCTYPFLCCSTGRTEIDTKTHFCFFFFFFFFGRWGGHVSKKEHVRDLMLIRLCPFCIKDHL